MGKLATRSADGIRRVPRNRVTVLDRQREGAIDRSEVLYKVTPQGPRDLKPHDLVEADRTCGVVPDNEVGATLATVRVEPGVTRGWRGVGRDEDAPGCPRATAPRRPPHPSVERPGAPAGSRHGLPATATR